MKNPTVIYCLALKLWSNGGVGYDSMPAIERFFLISRINLLEICNANSGFFKVRETSIYANIFIADTV